MIMNHEKCQEENELRNPSSLQIYHQLAMGVFYQRLMEYESRFKNQYGI